MLGKLFFFLTNNLKFQEPPPKKRKTSDFGSSSAKKMKTESKLKESLDTSSHSQNYKGRGTALLDRPVHVKRPVSWKLYKYRTS